MNTNFKLHNKTMNDKLFKDFLKFTESKQGWGTMDKARGMITAGYMNPYILEERQLNVTSLDIFSRLMIDRILFFGTEFTDDACNIAVSQLLYLENADPEKTITIYINSPGGGVYSGMGLIDTMNYISSPVATVNTGCCASMGAMLLMSGEPGMRSALPHSRTMIHQPLGGTRGQASDIEIEAKEILKLKEELYQVICDCSGASMDQVRRDADRDYWMTAEEAKNYGTKGLIDKIITKEEKK